MEAKDTVMHLDDIDEGRMPDSYGSQRKALEKQAEISFKAGKKAMLKDIEDGKEDIGDIIDSLCQEAIMAALKDGKKEGIKEVVAWIKNHQNDQLPSGSKVVLFLDGDWEIQLKEWGINP